MASHPAIVGLATSQYDRNPEYDDDDRLLAWDEIEPQLDHGRLKIAHHRVVQAGATLPDTGAKPHNGVSMDAS